MSGFVPHARLYQNDGITLVYTFPLLQSINAPQSVKDIVVLSNFRAKGALTIDGGEDVWDLILNGCFLGSAGDDYEELTAKIDQIELAIQLNQPYVFKFDKTSTTTYNYNVKRITPIEYPESMRLNLQAYTITFLVNSW